MTEFVKRASRVFRGCCTTTTRTRTAGVSVTRWPTSRQAAGREADTSLMIVRGGQSRTFDLDALPALMIDLSS